MISGESSSRLTPKIELVEVRELTESTDGFFLFIFYNLGLERGSPYPSSAASLRTDISPQRKEARPLSHGLTSDLYDFLSSRPLWSDGPEVALNGLFPYPISPQVRTAQAHAADTDPIRAQLAELARQLKDMTHTKDLLGDSLALAEKAAAEDDLRQRQLQQQLAAMGAQLEHAARVRETRSGEVPLALCFPPRVVSPCKSIVQNPCAN